LKKNRKRIDWARTDKNRLVTVTLQNGEPEFEIEQGKLDDFSPNAAVDVSQTPIETPAASVTETPAISSQVVHSLSPLPGEQPPVRSGSLADYVEVTARIPHVTTRVTIAIDVAPAIIRPLEPPKPVVEPPSPRDQEQRLARPRLAGGRPLPDLLFVTCSPRLAANVGAREAAATLAAIRDAGKVVHDVRVVENPFPEVRGAAAGKQGVVILGGYDVLPSQRYDVPPPDIRRAVGNRSGDPDNFVVWSDQGYGDTDGDGLADLPVSRIPDGRSVDLLWAALSSAPRQRSQRRFGLRNDARPFAIDVFDARMPGPEVMLASQPTGHSGLKPGNIDADAIYIMLHGSDLDGATFWGEDDAS
jgi:hypothetical protein